MGSAAIALVMLGFAVGTVFRLKVLLLVLALMLVVSVFFSLSHGFNFLETALTIIAVQCIVQGSYFLGLLVRAAVIAANRMRPVL